MKIVLIQLQPIHEIIFLKFGCLGGGGETLYTYYLVMKYNVMHLKMYTNITCNEVQ